MAIRDAFVWVAARMCQTGAVDNISENDKSSVGTVWQGNPFEVPQPANQFAATTGPETTFGPDDMVLLRMGHVTPPVNGIEWSNGEPQPLSIVTLGTYTMSLERAKELISILGQIVHNVEGRKGSQEA